MFEFEIKRLFQYSYKLKSYFLPQGDQPQAIAKICEGYKKYDRQCVIGVTGSGKTFTMANVIGKLGLPAMVCANKTLVPIILNLKIFSVKCSGIFCFILRLLST